MKTHSTALKSTLPNRKLALGLSVSLALGVSTDVMATAEKEELLKLRNTTINLIDMLVEQGVLDKDKAASMVKRAEKKAAVEAKEEADEDDSGHSGMAGGAAAGAVTGGSPSDSRVTLKNNGGGQPSKGPVRVTYVPDFVKDEIRADVRRQLKDEVVKEVKADAKDEKWGIPGALPSWVSKIKPFGDVRLRFEDQFFGSNNIPNSYYNWPLINKMGGLDNTPNPYINTTQNRERWRARARFGFESELAEGTKVNVRMSTSNMYSPITTNQT
ncbi:MAG: hypothetical protein RL661_275, partial [Pseudomonadota bacterium]